MTVADGCTRVTPTHRLRTKRRFATARVRIRRYKICSADRTVRMRWFNPRAVHSPVRPHQHWQVQERTVARKGVPRHVRCNLMPRSPTALVRKSIYLPYIPQGICPMKSSASVDPASRTTGTCTSKIQEPQTRQTELASAPPCATSRIDSAGDPALRQLGRSPVRRSSGMTPGAPLARPGKDAQAVGLQPLMSSSAAKANSAPQRQPSISPMAQSDRKSVV